MVYAFICSILIIIAGPLLGIELICNDMEKLGWLVAVVSIIGGVTALTLALF